MSPKILLKLFHNLDVTLLTRDNLNRIQKFFKFFIFEGYLNLIDMVGCVINCISPFCKTDFASFIFVVPSSITKNKLWSTELTPLRVITGVSVINHATLFDRIDQRVAKCLSLIFADKTFFLCGIDTPISSNV